MFKKHVTKELSAYCHNELGPDDARRVFGHLQICERCRKEHEEIRLIVHLAAQLPYVSAPASLWSDIESRLDDASLGNMKHPVKTWFIFPLTFGPRLAAFSAALFLILAIGAVWFYKREPRPSWEVARLEGAPTVGRSRIGEKGRLAVGEWLETDNSSRARINVGEIGHVEIDPNSRIRLIEADEREHRLALQRGRLHALITAPPRLFFVDTPSAVAVDYGCAYTLEVDEKGGSVLHVTAGWVALERQGRESIVPAGAMCKTHAGIGPGTPYFEDASDKFRSALEKFDFENGGSEALTIVLDETDLYDTLSLWHLLSRVNESDRGRVYDRIAEFVPPPAGVTRSGVLRLDRQMLELWRTELETVWFEG